MTQLSSLTLGSDLDVPYSQTYTLTVNRDRALPGQLTSYEINKTLLAKTERSQIGVWGYEYSPGGDRLRAHPFLAHFESFYILLQGDSNILETKR